MAQVAFLLLPLLNLAQANNYDDYVYNDPDQSEETTNPRIITEPLTVMVNEGDVIRLPCRVDDLDHIPLLWKKDSDIISIGDKTIDTRFCLESDNKGYTLVGITLVLGPAEKSDAGEYTCQLASDPQTVLRHQIKVKSASTTESFAPLLALLVCDCLSILGAMAAG